MKRPEADDRAKTPRPTDLTEGLSEICRLEAPGPFGLLIFGASGDLTMRKLVPAIYRLFESGLLPRDFYVLGASNEKWDDRTFRDRAGESARSQVPDRFQVRIWDKLESRLFYEYADAENPESFQILKRRLLALHGSLPEDAGRIFYLAVPPTLFEPIIDGIGNAGMASGSRITVEKPFGRDLLSARRLEAALSRYFSEQQIFRMDHYLAKETVQNILMFRFANSIFDPLWNQRHIDHVQITVSETLGVEDRAGYYEEAGIIRDMFQNHIFQLLALTAMEPPSTFEADLIRDEKVKVFRAVRPFAPDALDRDVVLGQYGSGIIKGSPVIAYREEGGVSADSGTATFAAMRVNIDNWRWHGVPFYLRSGKRLGRRMAEISVHFREVPHMMFLRNVEGGIPANVLRLRVQPEEGISLSFQTKTQGTRLCLSPVQMDFAYERAFSLSGYERVLLDCLQGDQTLFVRNDGVMRNWEIFTPLLESIESKDGSKHLHTYRSGTDGPPEAQDMIRKEGRQWEPILLRD